MGEVIALIRLMPDGVPIVKNLGKIKKVENVEVVDVGRI